jgi:hypothetical protein
MHLVQVVEDNTMMVPGYEHHTFMCSGCSEVERRLAFRPPGTRPVTRTTPASRTQLEMQTRASVPPTGWRRLIEKLRRSG